MMAAKNGHAETVRVLVEFAHADVNKKAGWNETTALMKAAEKGYAEVIRALVDLGADLNLINSVSALTITIYTWLSV
jgi:uncharacterized protein